MDLEDARIPAEGILDLLVAAGPMPVAAGGMSGGPE
jgi:hypothetical protein